MYRTQITPTTIHDLILDARKPFYVEYIIEACQNVLPFMLVWKFRTST
jgi:hypothetical protein